MRYHSLLLSSLLVTIIALPLTAQERTTPGVFDEAARTYSKKVQRRDSASITSAYARMCAGMKEKNINQAFAYAAKTYSEVDEKGTRKNLQQAIHGTNEFFKNVSNIKYRCKVESIRDNEQSKNVFIKKFITVSGTLYESGFVRNVNNSYSGEAKFEDTWMQTIGNDLTLMTSHRLSVKVAWAKPIQKDNSTRQSPVGSKHDLSQVFNISDPAIHECINEGRLEGCDRLNRIKSTLWTWCGQGDRDACTMYNSVVTTESGTRAVKMIAD
jgi:hypothetical protein